MRGYPKVGSKVRIKQTGEIGVVTRLWKPGRVMVRFPQGENANHPWLGGRDVPTIMYLIGIEPYKEAK